MLTLSDDPTEEYESDDGADKPNPEQLLLLNLNRIISAAEHTFTTESEAEIVADSRDGQFFST